MVKAFSPASRARLTHHDVGRFSGSTLFDRIARALCDAGCLPRRELYESWEVARRVRRLFRGGRIVDVAAGHGLLAHMMLLLDDSSPSALVVDTALPPSAEKVHAALVIAWPRLSSRVAFIEQSVDEIVYLAGDIVVSSHACGPLTDRILERASAAQARVAVLPCCHDLDALTGRELTGWIDPPLAMDIARAARLQQQGYRVWTQTIASQITAKNRLLIAAPATYTDAK
jgi:hypothetical protein